MAGFEVPLRGIIDRTSFARFSTSRYASPFSTPCSQLCLNTTRLLFLVNRDSVKGLWGKNKSTMIVKKKHVFIILADGHFDKLSLKDEISATSTY